MYDPGSTSAGWSADLSGFPAARWIWRGDVSPTAIADLQFAVFQETFTLGANPEGVMYVAPDDFAEVLVNRAAAGSTGSVTDETLASQSQSALVTIELTSHLVQGSNTPTIVGQNGPPGFAGCPGKCTDVSNTAGVMFAGTLSSA